MSRPSIREANAGDLPELARLRWDFRSEHGDVAPGTLYEGFVRRFEAFAGRALEEERWTVLVAERDGHLVGTVWLQLVPKIPAPSARGHLIGYLTNMYVEPNERDGGLGAALMDRVMAHIRGLPVEQVITWPTERSVPFYERVGFGRSGRIWERYLIDDPSGVWAAPQGPGPTGG